MNELDRYAVSLENMEVLRAQVEALEAWKAEELALINPLMDYARSVCTGPLGCSITEWLVGDHKRLAALSANHSEQVREMVPAWNLAADELPASGKTVLAFYLNSHGMGRRIRAMHVKRFTVEAEEFADPETQCCEYSEQDDCYYTAEGWYELIDNWPDYSSCAVIEGVITHWVLLPAAPSAGSQKEQE